MGDMWVGEQGGVVVPECWQGTLMGPRVAASLMLFVGQDSKTRIYKGVIRVGYTQIALPNKHFRSPALHGRVTVCMASQDRIFYPD